MTDAPEATGVAARPVDGRLAQPAAPPQDAAAWTLAALPLAVAAIGVPAASVDVVSHLVSALGLVAAFVLVTADRRMLDRSQRLSRAAAPSVWRALLPPTYLYARAKRLGTPLMMFWLSLASLVLAGVGDLATEGTVQEAAMLPGCAADTTVATAKSAFDNMLLVRQAGIHAIAVTDETEIGQGPGSRPRSRSCTAALRASDDVAYPVAYTVELTEHDEVIVHLQLETQ